mgnify:FL=1
MEFARENGLVFVEASAKSAEKVEEAFLRTAELVYQRQFSQDSDEVSEAHRHRLRRNRNL